MQICFPSIELQMYVLTYCYDKECSQLWVYHERPARGVGQYGGVLRAHGVGGQTLVVPARHLRVVRQHRQRFQPFRHLDLRLIIA